MNGRQLLLDTFLGKPTERVPVAPFVFNNVVNEAHGGIPEDPIAACADYYRKYGFDMLLRNYIIEDVTSEERISCSSWQVETERKGNLNQSWEERTVITTPERKLTQVRSYRRVTPNIVVDAASEYFIKSPEDFEQFKKYQPPLGKIDCSQVVHAREVVGEEGVACTWTHGAFNITERYRGLQDLLTDPYEDEDFYRDMMEYFTERLIDGIRQLIRAGSDLICFEGNMANGSMAGSRLFGEFVMPYENRIIDAIHEEGCFCIYHNCGDARVLLPYYDEMKMDMYESMTPPPYGDTILSEALEVIKPPKVLSGNLDQIDFLVHATPDQVRQRVKEILELAKPRGHFILATSDYFSEGTPEENIYAFAKAAREFGGY